MAAKKNKRNFRNVTDEELEKAIAFYKKNTTHWDFFSEREFLENILSQRVNFVIAVFALVLTAVSQVKENWKATLLYGVGTTLLYLLFISVNRIFARLKIVLNVLYAIEDNHVFSFLKKEIEGTKTKEQVNIAYILIPRFCMIVLLIGFVVCFFVSIYNFNKFQECLDKL